MKNFFRGSGIFVLLLAVILLMTFFFGGGAQKKPEELSYTEFLQKVSEEKVQAVAIVDIQLVGIYKDTTVKDFPDKGYDFTDVYKRQAAYCGWGSPRRIRCPPPSCGFCRRPCWRGRWPATAAQGIGCGCPGAEPAN